MSMESLLQNLEKHITCSICLDTFTKPKTIACLHTFCLKCLEKHALTTQRQGQFRCPECQAQVDIPQGNRFDNLPTGFFQNSLLSLLAVRQSGDGSQISCGSCRKTSAEISYCFDCGIFLCPDCVNAHELLRNVAFQLRTQSHASKTVSTRRLRGLVKATVLLLSAVPRERGNQVFLSSMSNLCLSNLHCH